jgi:hypothetical protein
MGERGNKSQSVTEDKREASLRAYEERVSNAWKDPPPASSFQFPGDEGAFFHAVMACHEFDDIVPLLDFLRSDRPLSAENRRNLAGLIEILHARSRPRRPGKPGGKIMRWKDPTYVATFVVETRLNAWRKEHGTRKVPDAVRDQLVESTIRDTAGWAMMQGKPTLDPERITTLLRESKARRL